MEGWSEESSWRTWHWSHSFDGRKRFKSMASQSKERVPSFESKMMFEVRQDYRKRRLMGKGVWWFDPCLSFSWTKRQTSPRYRMIRSSKHIESDKRLKIATFHQLRQTSKVKLHNILSRRNVTLFLALKSAIWGRHNKNHSIYHLPNANLCQKERRGEHNCWYYYSVCWVRVSKTNNN